MEYLPRVLLGEPICCWMLVISNIWCFHMFSLPLRVMELLTPVIHFCTMLWHQPDMISGCRGFAHWTFGVWTHRFSTRNKEREHEVRWSKESACSKMNMSPCLFVKQNCSCTANNQMLMCTQNYVGGCLSGVMWTSFILRSLGLRRSQISGDAFGLACWPIPNIWCENLDGKSFQKRNH